MGYSAFWQEIQKNEHHLASLPHRDAMEGISEHLKRHFPDLSPEIADNKKKKYTLVLTAHGMTDHFQDVVLLTRAAPQLENFEIEAFRQRVNLDGFDMKIGDFSLNCHDLYVSHSASQGQVALSLSFAKEIPAEFTDHAKNMAFILLDHMLGEFDFAIKVGPVEFIEQQDNVDAVRLSDYPPLFDHFWTHDLGHNGEYPQDECKWTAFELMLKDENEGEDKMIVLRNESVNTLVGRADMSDRLDVIVSLYDTEALEMTREYELRLDALLKPYQEGLCCQTMLYAGERYMSWYVTDVDGALMKAQNLANEFPDLEFNFVTEFDPNWSHYLRWAD